MSGKIKRVAVVGLGRQATEDHLPALMATSRAELIAVCDLDSIAGRSIANRYGVPYYQSCADLLSRERLDFVLVAVPHASHRQVTEAALRAGVHVLKEKPFAISVSDARFLEKLSREFGLEIMTTLQRRFSPVYNAFFNLVDEIGSLFAVDIEYTLSVDRPDEGWRGQRLTAGGGCLIDMGYHMLDLLIWYVGLPDRVAATMSSLAVLGQNYDAEDTANILLSWRSGVHGTMRISRATPPKTERFRLIGTSGGVEVERGAIRRFDRSGEVLHELTDARAWGSAAISQIEHFCDVIDGRAENHAGPMYHLQHAAFIDAAYRSASVGTFISLEGSLNYEYGK